MKYDFLTVIKLIVATLLPVLLSVALYITERKTKNSKISYIGKQTIIGTLYGLVAIFATQFGVTMDGTLLSVLDAAPLTAGLLFGAPAGIVSGVIGGTYRFIVAFFGVGKFSQVACTISCVIAGLFGAGCRKFMFGDKKPSWLYGIAIGATTEVFHMILIFVTNMNDVYTAYDVVSVCDVPLLVCNSLSLMLSLLIVSLIGKERLKKSLEYRQISQIFQFLLMICVLVAFAATMFFTASLQTQIAHINADNLLKLGLSDVKNDVTEAVGGGGNEEEEISRAISNRHIGQSGRIIVCDMQGIIIYDNGGSIGESVYSLSSNSDEVKTQSGVRFTATIGGTESFCMFEKTEKYYIIATIPVSEAMFSRNIAVTVLAFMEVIVFAALFAHVYFLLKKLIVDNIHKINYSLSQISDGNLSVHVNVRENQEFASLSDDINTTVDTLKRYISEAEGRIDRELEFARQIQHSVLPSVFPPYPDRMDFDIFATMDAAKEVGGDFYDFYFVDNSHLAFIVADVSGKGIPASLFMMRAKTLIKNLVESGISIDEAMTEANTSLSENNDAEMFVTAWLGKLDICSGVLEYVNAGHNPPLIKRANGRFDYLRTRPNFVLAGMCGTRYKKHTIELNSGDGIFVYTDGVTEAVDKNKKLYGEYRLEKVLNEAHGQPKDVCHAVRADIDSFKGNVEQFDDITMLCVKYNGNIKKNQLSTTPNKDSLKSVADFMECTLEKLEVSSKLANKVKIATDEIFSNIVNYSGANLANIVLYASKSELKLIFEDDGKPYNPIEAQEPDTTKSSEDRKIGGLGIHIVKKIATSMLYNYESGKNILTITFDI